MDNNKRHSLEMQLASSSHRQIIASLQDTLPTWYKFAFYEIDRDDVFQEIHECMCMRNGFYENHQFEKTAQSYFNFVCSLCKKSKSDIVNEIMQACA